eukprot:1445795-Alexandrium_andersonii.AAC.1
MGVGKLKGRFTTGLAGCERDDDGLLLVEQLPNAIRAELARGVPEAVAGAFGTRSIDRREWQLRLCGESQRVEP